MFCECAIGCMFQVRTEALEFYVSQVSCWYLRLIYLLIVGHHRNTLSLQWCAHPVRESSESSSNAHVAISVFGQA